MNHKITMKNMTDGELLELTVKANSGADALGKISNNKIRLKQPDPESEDPAKLKMLPFVPNGEWKVVSMHGGQFSYPEVVGMRL